MYTHVSTFHTHTHTHTHKHHTPSIDLHYSNSCQQFTFIRLLVIDFGLAHRLFSLHLSVCVPTYMHNTRTHSCTQPNKVSLVPRPLSEKSRRGLAALPYNGLSRMVCTVRANQIAEFQLCHVNRFVTNPVGVVPFDKALIMSDVAERKNGV